MRRKGHGKLRSGKRPFTLWRLPGEDVEVFSYAPSGTINCTSTWETLVVSTKAIYTYAHDPVHPTAYGPSSSPCPVSMPVTKLERVEMRRTMFPPSPDPENNSPKQLDMWD